MRDKKTVLEYITSWISQSLSLEFIDVQAKFHEYPIKLTDFCNALNAKYGLNIDPTVIYAFPTPERLAAHMSNELIDDKASVPSERSVQEPIAIVGMACRMPGHINSPEDYWNLLINGRDAITEVPASRWDIEAYYDPNPDAIDKMQTRFGGFIDHPEFFDSSFFNISPKEALEMDPQQRMFLQVCWEALENANIAPDSLNDSNTGVIVGMSINDYDELKSRYQTEIVRNPYHNISRYLSATAGRVSYFLNLHGPSYAMDVACASSLVATHNAVKLLQYRETDCVLVGGVNLLLDPEHTIGYDKAKMLSPDGRCKSFDESANGYVRSEGCGVLVLKRLSDAIAANHKILAVIKGSAVNQDGSTNGITAPNEQAQVDVIEQALQHAQLTPDDIGYIETHGTGTRLGDPIEFNAIKRVYSGRKKKSQLYLGAVKSNIGHLEAMSGLAGLMKAVLCLQHHIIPKNLHFSKLNPLIDLSLIHAELPLENTSWVADKTRHASVSGFSFIGTNAHVILEEAPISPIAELETGEWVICLSAKTETALNQLRQDYIQHLESHPNERIQDIVFTVNTGRARLDIKAYFKASTRELLLDNLNNNRTTDEVECTPGQGNKLILPTYPFEQQRYWLDFTRATPVVDESTLSSWCYGQRWLMIKPVMMAHDIAAVETLVIACNPALLSATKAFHGKDKHWHVMGYERGEGQIRAQLKKHEIGRVILLCQADSGQSIPEQSSQWMGLLLNLTQLLALETIKPELTVVTEHGQWVDKDSSVSLSLAPIMGFMKSMQLELPELTPRLIDVDDISDISMWSNLDGIARTETILAIRDGQYYGLRVEKQRLPESSPFTANPEGSYLITGGLGALGQVVASWLIERGAKHLVLTSRHAPTNDVQVQIDQWLKSSIDVQVMLADVSQADDVRRIMELSNPASYPLRGIFHAAGVNQDLLLRDMSDEAMTSVLQSKVAGAWYLHEQSLGISLDYFVLFSSISSFVGNIGQANYAAANSFLDELAYYRSREHLPAHSINWDAWDAGMWLRMGEGLKQGMKPLTIDEGLRLLNRIIEQAVPNVAVLKRDWNLLFQNSGLNFIPAYLSEVVHDRALLADSTAFAETLAGLDKDLRFQSCRIFVETTLREVLGLNDTNIIAGNKGFFELGLDSLMAVELRNKLQQALGGNYPLKQTLVFDYANLDLLSQYVCDLFSESQTLTRYLQVSLSEPIAIIGMSCRLPGNANTPEVFWDNLIHGVDGIIPVPKSRWDDEEYYSDDVNETGKMYIKEGGFIDHVDLFDANFFNISPREAACIDPQQRLLLEVSWEAIERAGINSQNLSGSDTGVFVGVSTSDYSYLNAQYGDIHQLEAYNGTGSALSALSGRLSYTLGLEGPSIAIDTACSSSLVAMHEAMKSLRTGECSLAISGGVNLMLSPDINVTLSRAKMLSPDGRCKSFDASANGYIRSDGCGVVILKRYSDALKDGDRVLALINGSAVNQDGASGGLTVPNGRAQVRLMQRALANANLEAGAIDYIEAHGTGTSLGDPIEAEAIGEVYGMAHSPEHPMILGAVKSNIGHLEAAAGIAGVMKTVLSLQHGCIPADLHFESLNPKIDADALHLEVASKATPWIKTDAPRRAAVSSFGFTGTNAHVIIEEAPTSPVVALETGDWVICLSAKTVSALEQLRQDYIHHLESHPDERIQDIVFTVNTGRAKLDCKAYFKASTRELLLDNLNNNRSTDEPECTPSQGNKLILPTYPFERQRYWLDFARATPMVDESTLSSWCYGQRWSIIKPVMMAHDIAAVETLVIACNPALLSATKAFHGKDKHWHVMGYEQGEGQIRAQLKKHEIGRVILLCQADSGQSIPEQSSQWMGLLLNLTQLLALETIKPELTVVTEHGQWVDKDSSVSLSLAPIMGFMKSMQLELPELTPRLIDVDDISDISMWSNLDGIARTETILAIRDGQYYGLRVEKQRLPESSPFTANPEGSYLITGGLGALGQVVASWLIERGAKHLVLTSRHAPTNDVQVQIDQWLKSSIDVQVMLADVSQADDVRRIMELSNPASYPLRGIFHAAGVNQDLLLRDMSDEAMTSVLQSKVAGAWYLHEQSLGISLDYFVLFSSISSFVGNIGQANYAAANSFLDELAYYRSREHLPAHSINWDAWDAGMWLRMGEGLKQGMKPLTIDEGLRLLNRIIEQAVPNVAVLKRDWNLLFQNSGLNFIPAYLSEVVHDRALLADSTAFAETLAGLDKDLRFQSCRIFVETTLREVLGLNDTNIIAGNKGFFELGLDSLMAVELRNKLQQALGGNYPLKQTLVFDYANLDLLSQYVCDLFSESQTLTRYLQVSLSEPIAIIGMSCRLPGNANTPEVFWDNLIHGVDGIIPVPKSRWDDEEYYSDDVNETGKMYIKEGGFIDHVDLFDANFFNISPREAACIDPQQRLLLEVSWEAIERAGINSQNLSGSDTGVFVGVSTSDYSYLNAQYGDIHQLEAYNGTGSALSALSGRLSYTLGLEGPSIAIDTACSSSLVAMHEAMKSLRTGECSLAISGGVNLMLSPDINVTLSRAKMLSPDGRCKSFDASANGYIRSDGCGVVILKRYSDALKDGDRVLALINGSAVNQDGASGGLTVPNGRAQVRLMQRALANANLEAGAIDYIEAHGTGTSLGDPIEAEAIGEVYGMAHSPEHPMILGAVKSNIGHLEAAAGIAGVMKTVLSLQHGCIPADLHFESLNPKIDADALHLEVASKATPWIKTDAPRRAAVSSFGFTGTNAHVIIEEAPTSPVVALETGDWVICLSAKTVSALEQLRQDYIHHLESHPDERIQDIVFTVNTGRAKLDCKAYFKASTRELLLDNLNNNRSTDEPECTPSQGNKLILPTYPFERQRYWLETTHSGQQTLGNGHPFLLRYMNFNDEQQSVFETDISKTWPEFIRDHYIYGHAVVAGATYLSAMISVIERLHQSKQAQLSNIEFIQPVVLDNSPTNMRTIRTVVDGQRAFKISSFSEQGDAHILHVRGGYELECPELPVMHESLDSIRSRCLKSYSEAEHLERAQSLSLQLGAHFSWIERVDYNEHELLAKMRLPDKVESKCYVLYPGFIDACFQTTMAWLGAKTSVLSIPIALKSFCYDLSGLSRPEFVYIRLPDKGVSASGALPTVDIYLLDKQGQVLGLIEGFQTRAVTQATLMNIISQQHQGRPIDYDYVEHWEKRVIVEAESSVPLGSVLLMSASNLVLADALALQMRQHQVAVTATHELGELPLTPMDTIIVMLMPEDKALDLPDAYRKQLRAVFDVTQALLQSTWDKPPRLWLVTQGGQGIMPHDEIHLSMSGVMGFYKTLIQEHPEFQARIMDIEPCHTMMDATRAAEQLYRLYLGSDVREGIWAIREEDYYVQRLVHLDDFARLEQHRAIPEGRSYRMSFERGSIASIGFSAYALREELGSDEAEIEIQASALNFRDVLNVQGLYPGDAGEAGSDCAGVVTRIGSGVRHLRVGDRVLGMSVGSFASHALGHADWLVPYPASLSPQEACTLPAVFLTSYIGLMDLGKLTSKDTVLIHGASGGVGLIAIQIAQHVGARIIATAGSIRKRSFLHGLGIQDVFDSRTYDYVERIQDATEHKGVDVVLNFLVGDFIEQTLSITKQGGRFIEIGKIDIYEYERMHQVRPDIDYHLVALDELMQQNPAYIRQTLKKLIQGLEEGIYHALPHTIFPFTKIIPAFNYMARVKQIGKVVLIPPRATLSQINPERPIIIIGGMGGIGYALAASCIARGALNLILTGRKIQDESMTARINALIEKNTRVEMVYEALDITNPGDCQRLITQWPEAQVIFNTAGIIEDATLDNLAWEAVNHVILPKVDGTWHLHQALQRRDIPLISFSSIASILGSGGQAHYAAANGFLNALSELRQQQQRQGQSIAWGPWAQVGMAKDLGRRHERAGMRGLKPDVGFNALWQLLANNNAPPTVMVADMQWDKLSGVSQSAFLDNLAPKTQLGAGELVVYLEKLAPEKRLEALRDKIRDLIAVVMGMSVGTISDDKGFFELGMDSLMAVELRNRLQAQVGSDKPLHSTIIFDYPTVNALAETLGQQLKWIENKSIHKKNKKSKEDIDYIKSLSISDIDKFIKGDLE